MKLMSCPRVLAFLIVVGLAALQCGVSVRLTVLADVQRGASELGLSVAHDHGTTLSYADLARETVPKSFQKAMNLMDELNSESDPGGVKPLRVSLLEVSEL